jgi:predicted RNase H-like HicB family nuclease
MKVRDVIKLIEADGRWVKMHRFLIMIEKADRNYSAYSPDLPGCVATGKTRDQVARNMHEAIDMHVRGLLEDKLPVPQSHSFAEYIAIPT